MNVAASAILTTVGLLFVELNMRSIWGARRVGQSVASVTQTIWSASRAFLDQIGELVEKISRVMRPGCSFGVILHTKDRQFLVTHSFDCAVVQVDVGHLNLGGERLRIDGEAVILCGDRHFAGAQIFDRLIRAAMAEFQLECRSAKSEPENLMTKTNPEDWFLAH